MDRGTISGFTISTLSIRAPSSSSDSAVRYISYTTFRQHLAEYMDDVCDSRAALHVTRRNARTVVLLSEEEFESIVEMVHLLRSPANARRLQRSVHNANTGKLIGRDID